ncbi:MAG: UDP-N-acetylmuramoyl-tripeptide--D-alanyl-D-alanine ligase [Actinobacteria bacterium]|nr:UDP-N-acetylmuramoyl-tripeptide--D-alanyl-D-alanine ligase [Actinomycetota bacterium]
MRFMAADVARAVGGELVGPNAHLSGVSFDSRTLTPGQLFVPIIDQRDGHDFIGDAINRGAGAYLTSREPQGRTSIRVSDTAAALLELGKWARGKLDDRLQNRVVGVTGSVGKTSTKDFIVGAVGAGFRVHANVRSLNNDFGLPTTILNAPDASEALVLEMGMRGFGEIAKLCRVANPTVGVVTAVASAHTERVGSIEGVARAKRELVEALPVSGTAILNADDERVVAMADATPAKVLTYGQSVDADVRMVSCEFDDRARAVAEVDTPWGAVGLRMQVSGRHMAHNALAALCVAGVLGVDLRIASTAISSAKISGSRMQMRDLTTGALLIDDSYNANPASMRAALETLEILPAKRRVAFCGLMAELADPEREHRAIRKIAGQLGIELVAVETNLYGVEPVGFEAAKAMLGDLEAGVAALVKGSKVAGLSRLCEGL